MRNKINHIKKRTLFGVVGFFIPGFTAIIILALRKACEALFENCQIGWYVIVILGGLISISAPAYYVRHINQVKLSLTKSFWLFGLVQYIALQSFLVIILIDADFSCNGHSAQNGLEYIFTAWLSIPIIIIIDYFIIRKYFRKP